jgi:glycogen debranching enzyme
MRIVHKLPKLSVERDGCGTSSCILSNKKGGFMLLSSNPESKFSGVFFNDGLDVFKVIEDIGIAGSRFDEVENHLSYVKRNHESNSEKIAMPEGIDGISYSLSKKARIFLDLDCRKVYDLRSFGRYYDISIDKGTILVQFSKRTDSKEDKSHDEDEFPLFIAIQPKTWSAKADFSLSAKWEEDRYAYDEERGDSPASRYVYRAFTVSAKELLIAFGTSRAAALSELSKLKRYKPALKTFRKVEKKKADELNFAFVCAQDSLDKLRMHHDGMTRIYAGFPWFFQLWSRDELVSLGAWIRLKQYRKVKEVLMNYIYSIGADGRLANRIPSSDLGNADAVGWLWKRVGEFIEAVKADGLMDEYLCEKEIDGIADALAKSIADIEKHYLKDGLIINSKNETWMDTDYDGKDVRDGARIEVQAMHLNMLHLMHELSQDASYEKRERVMRSDVLESSWNGTLLGDGAEDFTPRPNVFIAYYMYPDLLSRSDWQACFENVLESIWLEWGGLASIDRKNPLFTAEYTGIDNRSYHRGDSWFWLNNLAAICLYRNNAIKFEDRILKIIDACRDEILWHGAVGHHAELSSASHLSSKGCFAQAWSAAMFIELIMELYETK